MNTSADFSCIAELDLTPIKKKLMHVPSGEGWSREYTEQVEKQYRRFLVLMKKYPHEHTAPLVDVDIFWHYHILDTMKYAADCERVFGYFLHHDPHIGLDDEIDSATHQQSALRMQQLYELEFDEPYLATERAWQSREGESMAQLDGASSTPVACDPAIPQGAFCGAAVKESAFCGAAIEASAFCGAAVKASAFCGAAVKASAFCGAAVKASAYCGAAVKASAYCGAAVSAASYCGAAASAAPPTGTRAAAGA